jgi:hypothetical protein
MNGTLVYVETSLRARYPTEGQGRLVDELHECARRCLATAGSSWQGLSAWLVRKEPLPERLLVIVDCAELCEVTARSLTRGSGAVRRICGLTAELCERAAEAAETEPELAAFALDARRCARSCRSLAEGE